ncbi:DNA cytosine methyltransferase [Glycomyces sp. A-F 0318]|uniref:DNA cytosine methyltransferase n=1 Tax=Glycomyces amatae TaxID=2881355 RepID=UPI001E37AF5B|nr:DNA (cytosine-5-)-methyltransferase [Glycomyces amatae]MCD0443963.1 DNA cytosine methyltransferase [Glycomyces amatae]
MSRTGSDRQLDVVEICAGAGGQSLGLERAGFAHRLAVELDPNAAETLRQNLANGDQVVKVGDVASAEVWRPEDFEGVDLLAGGVPCPPFSIAGKQLGAHDERDLFAWAVELCGRVKPKALMLENVRGLSGNRFSAYRQHVLDRLHEHGYIAEWSLLHASSFGVSQQRPRFVLIALREEYAPYFSWPERHAEEPPTVGELLKDLMSANGWERELVEKWAVTANGVAPTIVGGSKRHGGADLGPTRAKRAWSLLGVDAMGVADMAPGPGWEPAGDAPGPRLTNAMVARIQGWTGPEFSGWRFHGRKTSVYRQIGNAFPPPVAKDLGAVIRKALLKTGQPKQLIESTSTVHDPVYRILRSANRSLTPLQIEEKLLREGIEMKVAEIERHINHLGRDFKVEMEQRSNGAWAYKLERFEAFIGQLDHDRNKKFAQQQSRIS